MGIILYKEILNEYTIFWGSFSKRFSDSPSYCDSLRGDERAVPPGVKSCLDREPTPPTLPHILAKEAAKNAGKEIAKKLFKYYH